MMNLAVCFPASVFLMSSSMVCFFTSGLGRWLSVDGRCFEVNALEAMAIFVGRDLTVPLDEYATTAGDLGVSVLESVVFRSIVDGWLFHAGFGVHGFSVHGRWLTVSRRVDRYLQVDRANCRRRHGPLSVCWFGAMVEYKTQYKTSIDHGPKNHRPSKRRETRKSIDPKSARHRRPTNHPSSRTLT